MSRRSDATELLNNKTFQEIKGLVEKSLFDQWLASATNEEREIIHRKLALLDDMIGEINAKALETSNE